MPSSKRPTPRMSERRSYLGTRRSSRERSTLGREARRDAPKYAPFRTSDTCGSSAAPSMRHTARANAAGVVVASISAAPFLNSASQSFTTRSRYEYRSSMAVRSNASAALFCSGVRGAAAGACSLGVRVLKWIGVISACSPFTLRKLWNEGQLMLISYAWPGSSETEIRIARSDSHIGLRVIFGNFGPPPQSDMLVWFMSWSNSILMSVLPDATPTSPWSGSAETTRGGSASTGPAASVSTARHLMIMASTPHEQTFIPDRPTGGFLSRKRGRGYAVIAHGHGDSCMRTIGLIVTLSLLAAFLGGCASPKGNTAQEKRDYVLKEREATLTELYKLRPHTKESVAKSAGYGVFSNIGASVILVSAGGGFGVVHDNGTGKDTYMKVGSGGVGPGLGAKDFRAVFIFNNKDALNSFMHDGWDWSAETEAAAKTGDQGGAANTSANSSGAIEVYQITKTGIIAAVKLAGTKYWLDEELNVK